MHKTQEVSVGSDRKSKSVRQNHVFLMLSVFRCRSYLSSGVSSGALLTWPSPSDVFGRMCFCGPSGIAWATAGAISIVTPEV